MMKNTNIPFWLVVLNEELNSNRFRVEESIMNISQLAVSQVYINSTHKCVLHIYYYSEKTMGCLY
jgi:hypothetical protein